MFTDGLMLSYIIDAMEGRELATADIQGNFPQTSYDKRNINIQMEGTIVTLSKEIYPK